MWEWYLRRKSSLGESIKEKLHQITSTERGYQLDSMLEPPDSGADSQKDVGTRAPLQKDSTRDAYLPKDTSNTAHIQEDTSNRARLQKDSTNTAAYLQKDIPDIHTGADNSNIGNQVPEPANRNVRSQPYLSSEITQSQTWLPSEVFRNQSRPEVYRGQTRQPSEGFTSQTRLLPGVNRGQSQPPAHYFVTPDYSDLVEEPIGAPPAGYISVHDRELLAKGSTATSSKEPNLGMCWHVHCEEWRCWSSVCTR